MFHTISFNGKDLNFTGNTILAVDDTQMPELNIKEFSFARSDGIKITDSNYGKKKITIEGILTGNSLNLVKTYLGTLKLNLRGIDKVLAYTEDGVTINYIATLSQLTYEKSGLSRQWKAVFDAQPFGESVSDNIITPVTIVDSNTNLAINGIVKSNTNIQPSLRFDISMVNDWWSQKFIQVKNEVTGEGIKVSRIWNWFDSLIVDTKNKQVSVIPGLVTAVDRCEAITGWTINGIGNLTLETVNMKEGAGALNVTMTSTQSSIGAQRLNATPINMNTDKGFLIIPIFIPTPASGTVASVTVTIGSDADLTTNKCSWVATKQYDGSNIATNAWNYFKIDLSSTPAGTFGTPVRTAIKSILIYLSASATMSLSNILIDNISIQKAGTTTIEVDYQGIIPEWDIDDNDVNYTDEFSKRVVYFSGSYKERML